MAGWRGKGTQPFQTRVNDTCMGRAAHLAVKSFPSGIPSEISQASQNRLTDQFLFREPLGLLLRKIL